MKKPYILFFSNSIGHRKVQDRILSAKKSGFSIELICYNKGHDDSIKEFIKNSVDNVYFVGSPTNSNLTSRFKSWIKSYFIVKKIIQNKSSPDILIANTVEWLIFSLLFKNLNTRFVYDLADLHKLQYSRITTRIFCFFEKIAFERNYEVVVTSPWFYWNYLLNHSKIDTKCFLIENKITLNEFQSLNNSSAASIENKKIIIAWTGILRCNSSLNLLINLCEKYPGKFNVWLIGIIDQLDANLFKKATENQDFMLKGKYQDDELGSLIRGAHFMWSCDFDDGLNSKLLIPNRMYQAIAANLPQIGFNNTATGTTIETHKIGILLQDKCIDELHDALTCINDTRYQLIRENCTKIKNKIQRGDEWSEFFSRKNNTSTAVSKNIDPTLVLR